MSEQELRRKVIELVSGAQTGILPHNKATEGIMHLITQYGAQCELSGSNWQEVKVGDKSTYPPYNQVVLARMTYDNGKYAPIYVAVKHVDEDDCDWRTSDGDELSYWVNITHWQRIAELKAKKKSHTHR